MHQVGTSVIDAWRKERRKDEARRKNAKNPTIQGQTSNFLALLSNLLLAGYCGRTAGRISGEIPLQNDIVLFYTLASGKRPPLSVCCVYRCLGLSIRRHVSVWDSRFRGASTVSGPTVD